MWRGGVCAPVKTAISSTAVNLPAIWKTPPCLQGGWEVFKVFFLSLFYVLPRFAANAFLPVLPSRNRLHAKHSSFNKLYRRKKKEEREREKVGGLHNRQQTPWQYSCYMLIQTPWASVRTVRGTAAALRSLLNKMCKHTLALFNKEHHYLAQNICWHHHG